MANRSIVSGHVTTRPPFEASGSPIGSPGLTTAASVLLVAAVAACSGSSVDPADLVLRGGAVYTLAEPRWAEALAIREGQLTYVGPDAGVHAHQGSDTRVLNLQGAMVLPGLHDSHVHPVKGGLQLAECDLNGIESRPAIARAIAACRDRQATGHWLRGRGWELPDFPDGSPDRTLLDSLVPDRPTYLISAGGHSAWVNTRALEAAGITSATPDPPDGRIERDRTTGEPTGTLREGAMRLVERHIPDYPHEQYVAAVRRALACANRFGITSVHEAAGTEPMLEAYAALDRQGELSARVVASMRASTADGPVGSERLREWRKRFRGRRFRAAAAKIFADGVIEAGTAALLEPYVGRPGERGMLSLSAVELTERVRALDADTFQIHIHAIGDRAVRVSLDAFANARAVNGIRDARHQMAHIQLIHPRDLPRFAELDVIADFQPLWAYADRYIVELTEPRLGPGRSRWLYPIASVAATGAIIVAGSDWPVTSMDPLQAIQVAVSRRAPDAGPGPAWIPEERVSLPTILQAYTINGAYLNRQETITGSLEVGKAADLVVLDRNLFEVPGHEIHEARVLLTLLEGEAVYRDSAWSELAEWRGTQRSQPEHLRDGACSPK